MCFFSYISNKHFINKTVDYEKQYFFLFCAWRSDFKLSILYGLNYHLRQTRYGFYDKLENDVFALVCGWLKVSSHEII